MTILTNRSLVAALGGIFSGNLQTQSINRKENMKKLAVASDVVDGLAYHCYESVDASLYGLGFAKYF